jgi:hypothetical protein
VPPPATIADACGRALRRGLPAIIAGAIVMALGGSAYAGYRFVTTSPRFAITQITVQGNHRLATEEIRAALPVAPGDNVFAADLDGVTRTLHANPWIARAEVHRVLPHTLVIDIGEHEAAAIVELGDTYLVDPSGHPFKRASADERVLALPRITGLDRSAYLANAAATAEQVQRALAALANWQAGADRPQAAEVHLDPHGALVLRSAAPELEIELGSLDAGLAARMQTFDAAWGSLGASERALARAIFVETDHVTLAFKDP